MVMREPLECLEGFADLESNWNSYGAPPIAPESIAAARRFLTELRHDHLATAGVVPTTRSGVQLEWHINGVDIELEFHGGEVRSLYVEGRPFSEDWLHQHLAQWLKETRP